MGESGSHREFKLDDTVYQTRLTDKFLRRKPFIPGNPRRIVAALPGVVELILVRPGQKVKRGAPLLVLEAMKMRNAVTAPVDGVVRKVRCSVGDMVAKGQLLVDLE